VERTVRRGREAQTEYERTVARAARLGLAQREIAAAAQIAHGTIRAILARVSDTMTQPASSAATGAHHEPEQHDGEPPVPDATPH
jgi:DNA-binding NarL/FixJ family response regulator